MKIENVAGFCSYLGNLLYTQRRALRHTQEECALYIHTTKSTYCRMEKEGFSSLPLEQLLLLCCFLEVDLVAELSYFQAENDPEYIPGRFDALGSLDQSKKVRSLLLELADALASK